MTYEGKLIRIIRISDRGEARSLDLNGIETIMTTKESVTDVKLIVLDSVIYFSQSFVANEQCLYCLKLYIIENKVVYWLKRLFSMCPFAWSSDKIRGLKTEVSFV